MSPRVQRAIPLAGIAVALAVTLAGCATPSPAATSAASVPAQYAPRLGSADNFRDIGGIGTGYATADGKHVALGVVYRSNALALKPTDVEMLKGLDITHIYDLRTQAEISAKPDSSIPGAVWQNDDVIGSSSLTSATPHFATAAEADTMMEATYRDFVSSKTSRAAIAEVLKGIADNKGAAVIHCTAGKDRTGWISALLLGIAGVDQAQINQNYLLTNQYSRASISATLAGITAQQGPAAAAAYAPLMGVQQSFLDASYDEAKKEYGGVDGYLTHGLGLSKATIAKLKAKLTV